MATTRKAANLAEGYRGSLEQLTDKGISPDLLQKMFEEFGKKVTATVKTEMEKGFAGIKKGVKEEVKKIEVGQLIGDLKQITDKVEVLESKIEVINSEIQKDLDGMVLLELRGKEFCLRFRL